LTVRPDRDAVRRNIGLVYGPGHDGRGGRYVQ